MLRAAARRRAEKLAQQGLKKPAGGKTCPAASGFRRMTVAQDMA